MAGFDPVSFAVIAFAVSGLVAVLLEILVKDPRSLLEMTNDSRRFAEVPLRGDTSPADTGPAVRPSTADVKPAANHNHPRLAA
ncbi:MAG TPA: hypothetical protein VLB05_06445 [Dongiaceae bacterium]|jgi:hypothetical protein|nr:hypothetical protein [Dongiaceae bacterium]